jgi:hypothetical protein
MARSIPVSSYLNSEAGRGSQHGTDESHHSVSSDDVRLAEVTFRSTAGNEVVRMMVTIAGGAMSCEEEPST